MRTILVFNEIGHYGTTAEMFSRELDFANGDDIEVRLNSPGGDVFEGITIYNMLKSYAGNVKVIVDGLAASIASVIALGGDEIVMNEGSFFMIHNPWSGVMGESEDFRKQADILDSIRNQILGIYQNATGLGTDELIDMMNEETWLTAEEAIELGFANSQQVFNKVAANLNFFNKTTYFFNKIPMELKQMNKKEVIHNEVAEAELEEVQVEEAQVEESETEEFTDLEFVASAELEDELEEDELEEFEDEDEELEEDEEELEEEILYTEEEVLARIEMALAEEQDRQEQIRNLSFPGQEDLVAELIKDKVELKDASVRIINHAKTLDFSAKSEGIKKENLLEKLNSAAPKSLDSKEEPNSLEILRAKAAKETDPKAKRELIRKINKLKKA